MTEENIHDQSPIKNVARPGGDQTLDLLITDWATEASLDNCAAQNKNRYIFSMFWYAIQLCLESIEKKVFRKGTNSEWEQFCPCFYWLELVTLFVFRQLPNGLLLLEQYVEKIHIMQASFLFIYLFILGQSQNC